MTLAVSRRDTLEDPPHVLYQQASLDQQASLYQQAGMVVCARRVKGW